MRNTLRPKIPTCLALAALSAVACAADATPDPGLDVTVLHSRMKLTNEYIDQEFGISKNTTTLNLA
jgi:hypothetical protein